MSEYLPYGEFERLKNVDSFDVMSTDKKSDVGYTLEVTNDILSNYCKSIADKYDIKAGDIKKLIPNLGNKNKYVVHYRNLQLYLS